MTIGLGAVGMTWAKAQRRLSPDIIIACASAGITDTIGCSGN